MQYLEELTNITHLDTLHSTDNGVLYRVARGGMIFILKVPNHTSDEIQLLEKFAPVPGIITPVESGLYRGRPAVLLPYAREELLSRILDGRGVQPRAFQEIARAVDTMHQMGVIHRDIHPGNILFVEGAWVLTDLGIARPVGAAGDGSHGVVRFSSPAQLRGDPPSPADDLYSLFLTMSAALLGHLPWEGTPQTALFLKKEREAPKLPPRLMELFQSLSAGHPLSAVELVKTF